MSLNWYAHGEALGVLGTLQTNGLKAAWFKSTYTPNFATDTTYTSIVATESSGSGYTAGGMTCTSVSVPVTAANSWATPWAASTAFGTGAIIRPAIGNGFLYYCSSGGTTAGTTPTFPTVEGATVSDNGVIWTCLGTAIIQLLGSIPTLTFTSTDFQKLVFYDSSTKVLVCCWNSGNVTPITAQPVSVTPDATGIAYKLAA